MGKLSPQRQIGRFGHRNTAGTGGSRNAGPMEEFPLGYGPWAMRNFFVSWNDFERLGDLETTTDWTGADIGAAAGTANTIIVDPSAVSAAYGVLRVNGGTADSTGRHLSRAFSGTNAANGVQLQLVSTGDPANANASNRAGHRRVSFGARIRVTETGTATQSAIAFGLTRDEEAHLTTAGAVAGIAGCFGFSKVLATNNITAFSRNTATVLSTSTVATIVPGTSTVTGTWVEISGVAELRTTSAFYMDCYVNGQYITQHVSTPSSAGTPSADAYSPFFTVVNGVGADCTLDVDYYWMMSERF
jgi:hypothetical protein